MRRAKIVCTLGPATSSPRRIRELVYAGMDVARLNMSHGTHADHARVLPAGAGGLRRQRARGRHLRRPAGPEDPAGDLRGRTRSTLRRGQEWTITTRDVPGDDRGRRHDVRGPARRRDGRRPDPHRRRQGPAAGARRSTTPTCVTEVLVGGPVSNHKGINLPGVAVSVPALSEKDVEDLRFALHLTVDFIALSFVRDAKDAEDVREVMDEEGVHAAGDRQDREAAGDREPRRGGRRVRRLHGRPRRPGRGVPAGGRAVPAEADHREGPAERQAGHRGHPDAGVDDQQPRARPAPRRPTSPTRCSTAPTR